jgi:hypothetical protein
MAWLANFLLKRKARQLVPSITTELAKSYGAATAYTPGQVQATLKRLKVPSALMPTILAGVLSKEAFAALFSAHDYQKLRENYISLLPTGFEGGTENHTDPQQFT